jgi:hypothetical protein
LVKLKEKDIYDEIKDWLYDKHTSDFDDYCSCVNQQIYFGNALRVGFDVMIAGFEVTDRVRTPSEWRLTDIYICECKLLWSAYQAFGQLAFYQSIVENYMKSGHWNAFNKDYCDGPMKYFEKKKTLPAWWKEDGKDAVYYLSDKIDLHQYLVLYCKDSRDIETREYVKFIGHCLSQQGTAGLVVYWNDRKRNKIECVMESGSFPICHGGRQRPAYDVEDACFIPPFPTKQTCRMFTLDGKYHKMKQEGRCLRDIQNSCVGCDNNW